jgi:hypothetical protein
MQRTVSNHTCAWVRASFKCEMSQEATEYWSASNLMCQFKLLHPNRMWEMMKDRQGYHHRPPTPQPWTRTMHSPASIYPSTMLVYREATQAPRVPDPTDRQVRSLGTPEGTMNRHLNLALFLIISMIWMIKHKVLYDNIMTYKLQTSSYIKIISQELYSSSYA